jgi:hypothetical protein
MWETRCAVRWRLLRANVDQDNTGTDRRFNVNVSYKTGEHLPELDALGLFRRLGQIADDVFSPVLCD